MEEMRNRETMEMGGAIVEDGERERAERSCEPLVPDERLRFSSLFGPTSTLLMSRIWCSSVAEAPKFGIFKALFRLNGLKL